MPAPPDNGGGRRRPHRQTGLDTERPADPNSLQEQDEHTPHTDPAPVGELVAAWVGVKLAEVDDLVDEARAKVDAIPDRRSLMLLIGELTVRLHCVELAIDELKAAKR